MILCSCRTDPQTKATSDSEELELGKVTFEVTGAEEAKKHFIEGILLLHSFEYQDARTAFQEAIKIDPDFTMAYWGEAMTHNRTLWQGQDREDALAVLEQLGATPEERRLKASTPLEKDFMDAIEILYGEGTKYDRDLAYSEFMQGLTEKYPDHHEVAAFYAISLLGASRNGRDPNLYDHSARIAQGIIDENPSHPGALHYLIHSYDDPEHAPMAKKAADSYSKVAPDATHALHMPSHIYVALGDWDNVVTSNIASWNASVRKAKERKNPDSPGSYHALNWLQYGLLQRGEKETAAQLLDNMIEYTNSNSTKNARSYLVAMKGGQIVETNGWSGKYAGLPIKVDDLNIVTRTGYALIEGLTAYHRKDIKALSNIIEKVSEDRSKSELLVGEKGFAMCSAGGYANKPPSLLDINMTRVMELELLAVHADLSENVEKADDYFRRATELDEQLSYSYGPPDILKPVHEAYGEWLLKEGKWNEAGTMFEKSLKRNPRRLLSFEGLRNAAEQLNNSKQLATVDHELQLSTQSIEWEEIL